MYRFPKTARGLNSRISAYWSTLKSEKRKFKFIDDSSGSRYVIFCYLFVLNDLDQSKKYFRWYQREFPDDIGEPIQIVCWALGLYRMGKLKEARIKLADLMSKNLYLIPVLLGREVVAYDIWHSSNYAMREYADHVPKEILSNITKDEMKWMEELFDSPPFEQVREKQIEISRELGGTRDIEKRRKLIDERGSLIDRFIV